jgi:hypothetical protein
MDPMNPYLPYLFSFFAFWIGGAITMMRIFWIRTKKDTSKVRCFYSILVMITWPYLLKKMSTS